MQAKCIPLILSYYSTKWKLYFRNSQLQEITLERILLVAKYLPTPFVLFCRNMLQHIMSYNIPISSYPFVWDCRINCSEFPFFVCAPPYVIQIIPKRDFVSVQSEKLIWVAISGEGNLRNRLQSKINNNISEWLQIQLLCHRNVIYLQDVMMTSTTTTTYNDNVFPPAEAAVVLVIHPGRKCHCLHWILIWWLTARAYNSMGHQSVTATYPSAVFYLHNHSHFPMHWFGPQGRRSLVPWMGE